MKKLGVCLLFVLMMACLMATSASAARSLQKGEVTLRLPSGAADLVRVTPTPAPARDPASLCKALGHNYKKIAERAATCSKDGSIKYECSVCGQTKTETIDATGDHNYDYYKQTAATCTSPAYRISKCDCGDEMKELLSQALGHDWGEWTAASKTKLVRKCSRCSETQSKDAPKEIVELDQNTPTPKPKRTLPPLEATAEPTATPRPYHGHQPDKATAEPTATPKKTLVTPKPTATLKGEKATATPKPTKKPSSGKAEVSYDSYDYYAQDGMIEIFSTSGKVNLRTGPGKKNGIANQVSKKNTSLGQMLDAQVDSTGNVWFKVRYKNKNSWITSDYARAVIGDVTNSSDRHVGVDSVDLSDVCFDYISEAADHYGLDLDMSGEASNNELSLRASGDFIESIEICGEGYALYGIGVGDKLKTVENAMKKNGLYCASKSGSTYVYKRPIQPYSMCVNDEGFDSYIEVVLDDSKCVESISWNAYTE